MCAFLSLSCDWIVSIFCPPAVLIILLYTNIGIHTTILFEDLQYVSNCPICKTQDAKIPQYFMVYRFEYGILKYSIHFLNLSCAARQVSVRNPFS